MTFGVPFRGLASSTVAGRANAVLASLGGVSAIGAIFGHDNGEAGVVAEFRTPQVRGTGFGTRGTVVLKFTRQEGTVMAKTAPRDDLVERLRAGGLRKRTAKLIADATGRGRKPASGVEKTLADLRRAVREVEDRFSGGPSKRSAAAKKAANTRKRNAQRRSEAAKRGARTRAKAK